MCDKDTHSTYTPKSSPAIYKRTSIKKNISTLLKILHSAYVPPSSLSVLLHLFKVLEFKQAAVKCPACVIQLGYHSMASCPLETLHIVI